MHFLPQSAPERAGSAPPAFGTPGGPFLAAAATVLAHVQSATLVGVDAAEVQVEELGTVDVRGKAERLEVCTFFRGATV